MDKMDWTLPPKLEIALKKYYTTPEPTQDFAARLGIELRRRHSDISDRARDHTGLVISSLRARPALVILLAILALLLLSGVAYAIGRLSGFIPGFGFTSGDAYILDVPVSVTQNSIVIRVEQAVHDAGGLWVKLSVQGLPEGDEYTQAYILSQSGEKIQALRGGSISSEINMWRVTYVFPGLDVPSQPVTLLLEDPGGQTFQVKFTLRSARSDEVLPVSSGGTLPAQGELHEHMLLALDNIAMSSDRTVLQVSLHFDQPGITLATSWGVTMTDDLGRIFPLTDISPETMDIGTTRLYQTGRLQGNEHLIFNLVSFPSDRDMPMLMDFSTHPAAFTFDPGTNPQIGQTWPLDETLHVGQFTIHLVGARITSPTQLVFEFEPTQNVTGVMLYSTLAHGAAGGVPAQNGHFTAAMSFAAIPKLPFEIQMRNIYYMAHGHWQVDWQAPVTAALGFPTMSPVPTLTPRALPTVTSQDPLLLKVQALLQKFDLSMIQGPAWIHVVNERITEHRQAGQTYPPPYYQEEQWYEIDAAGWVTRSLTTDHAVDGDILQQSVSIGTKGMNLTTGDVFENTPYRLSFDLLTRDLDDALTHEQPVFQEETTCEDRSRCLLITIQGQFNPPIENTDQPSAFYGHGVHVWLNVETGQQVKYQNFKLLEDGTEQVDFTQRALLIENVIAPPNDVLDIMARIVLP